MIIFRNLTLSDKNIIDAYCALLNRESCEYCFGNLYGWSKAYAYQFAFFGDALCLSFKPEDGATAYMMPLAEKDRDLQYAIRALYEDHRERGSQKAFSLLCLSPEDCKRLRRLYPDAFLLENDRNEDEYMYEADSFRTYAGKALHGKRNHYNKFIQLYGTSSYEEITKANAEECLCMSEAWQRNNGENGHGTETEEEVIRTMLRSQEELALSGGCLRINGQIVAFTIGEPLAAYPDTVVIHVEKAQYDIPGAYPAIASLYLQHHPEFRYVNREEDMGLEGLRQSKLSYRLLRFVQKYHAVLTRPLGPV